MYVMDGRNQILKKLGIYAQSNRIKKLNEPKSGWLKNKSGQKWIAAN